MAAGSFPRPGTEYGPCETECQHRDCAATRRTVAAPCPRCGKPIGWDTRFYYTDDVPEHAYCLETALEN